MSPLSTQLGNWTAGDGPLYRLLADRIGQLVSDGLLRPDDKLPPERVLADDLAVSRSTAVAAYALLAERGVVVRRQGSGTRIAATAPAPPGQRQAVPGVNELFRQMLADEEDMIDLGAYTLPRAAAVSHVLETLAGPELDDLLASGGYLPYGLPSLRRRLAESTAVAHDLPTDSSQILMTTGAQQGISLIASQLIRPGDAVITEEATYGGALDVFRAAGARLFAARSDAEGIDVDDLEQVVARVRPSMIYLVATHNNPTGSVLPPARRRAVVDIARRYHVPVVDDLALCQLHLDPAAVAPPPLAYYAETGPAATRTDLVLSVDSLAKTYWGGLRLGWVRASPGMINRLARSKTITDLGSPPVMQLVASRLLDHLDETLRQRSVALREGYAALSAQLADLLPDWEYVPPRGGPVLWLRMPAGSARGLAAVALRHGVTIAPGPAFSPVETFADHVRIPFGGPRDQLEQGVKRLAAAWHQYEPDTDAERTAGRPLL